MLCSLKEVRTAGPPSRAEAMNNEGERSLCLDKRPLSSARIIFDTRMAAVETLADCFSGELVLRLNS